MIEQCFWEICFFRLNPDTPEIFVFAEFLTGLALMVLAWTIADVRYRFRIDSAPVPLKSLTFIVVAIVGTLTLLTDLWRAEGWLVPRGSLLTPVSWQAILAGALFITFMLWAWFAFISPPQFGKRNTKQFARALYRAIQRGSPPELAVIGDELSKSANSLIYYASDLVDKNEWPQLESNNKVDNPTQTERFANDILLLIADKRFCKEIVETSPITVLRIFDEVRIQKKYGIQIQTFAKNIITQALINRNSFIYHEFSGYKSGLIGYHKLISNAMFSNYEMVETIGVMLDPDPDLKWKAEEWEAYFGLVLITFKDYIKHKISFPFESLLSAFNNLDRSINDLYLLKGVEDKLRSDQYKRVRVAIRFIKSLVNILDQEGMTQNVSLRSHLDRYDDHQSFYDHIANMILDVISQASAVRSPSYECWNLQSGTIWNSLFFGNGLDSGAGHIVKFKLRRLIYKEITLLEQFSNYRGAMILGFCLNVMGFTLDKKQPNYALHKVILNWTKRNYTTLYNKNPNVAAACLVDDMSYDSNNLKLVKTYPANAIRSQSIIILQLDPPKASAA